MVSVINEKNNAGRGGIVPGNVGETNVPPGHEKARFVIDLTTSKVAPEAAFGRQ
jgi:hypothetical protein